MNFMTRAGIEVPRTPLEYATTILRDGFAEQAIDASFLRPRIEAIRGGMRLLTQSPGLAALFPWRMFASDEYGTGYGQEVGLEHKEDDERKWKFQHTPGCFAFVPESQKVPLRAFFEALCDLDVLAKRIAHRVAASFDEYAECNGIRLGVPLTEKVAGGICITRVLCYPRVVRIRRRAKTHIDRCFITPHWWGSHSGLKLHTPQGSWKGVDETSFDRIAVFCGEKFAACTQGQFGTYGTPHGVWCEDLDEDRYAIVSFVHPRAYPEDCVWLRENAAKIKAYEESLLV